MGEALVEELNCDSPAGCTGCSHTTSPKPTRPSGRSGIVKAGDAARAGYAQEEAIGLYRRALGFMERTGDAARARSTLLKIALTHHLAFDYAPRTKPSAKRSPDLRQRLRGSNLASEPRGR